MWINVHITVKFTIERLNINKDGSTNNFLSTDATDWVPLFYVHVHGVSWFVCQWVRLFLVHLYTATKSLSLAVSFCSFSYSNNRLSKRIVAVTSNRRKQNNDNTSYQSQSVSTFLIRRNWIFNKHVLILKDYPTNSTCHYYAPMHYWSCMLQRGDEMWGWRFHPNKTDHTVLRIMFYTPGFKVYKIKFILTWQFHNMRVKLLCKKLIASYSTWSCHKKSWLKVDFYIWQASKLQQGWDNWLIMETKFIYNFMLTAT